MKMKEEFKQIWREPFDCHELSRHVDHRGFLFEILRFKDDLIPGDGQLYVFSIEPDKRRGDHYHLRKREWFTCVYGEAIVLLSTGKGKTLAEKISAENPKIIYAGPGTSHALVNESDKLSVIISYGSEQHNPDGEDTYHQVAFENYSV